MQIPWINSGLQHDPGHHLHVLRHSDEEGARKLQRGQVHRLHDVHHVHHLARIYSHLLWNGKLIRGIEIRIWKPTTRVVWLRDHRKISLLLDSDNDALHIDFTQRLRHTLLSLLAKDIHHRLPSKDDPKSQMGEQLTNSLTRQTLCVSQPEKNVRKLTMNSAAGKKNTASLISE